MMKYDIKKDFSSVVSGKFFLLKTKISGSFLFIGAIITLLLELVAEYMIYIHNGTTIQTIYLIAIFIVLLYLYIVFIINRLNSFGRSNTAKALVFIGVLLLGTMINLYISEGFHLFRIFIWALVIWNSNDGLFFMFPNKKDRG